MPDQISFSRESISGPIDGFLAHDLNWSSPHTQLFPDIIGYKIDAGLKIEQIRRLFILEMGPTY